MVDHAENVRPAASEMWKGVRFS